MSWRSLEDWNLFLRNKDKGYMSLTTMEEVQVFQTREEEVFHVS